MVVFAALVLAAAPAALVAPPQPVAAERQANAMVQIFKGAPVRFSELEKSAPASFSNARIRGADGSSEAARLIEFQ